MLLNIAILVIFLLGVLLVYVKAASDKVIADLQHRIGRGVARQNELVAQANLLDTQAETRNTYLDYLFRTFCLNLSNPYVIRPTFEEKRCYHCHYPEYAGHDNDCAWLHCYPITSALYPPPVAHVEPSAVSDESGNILLPASPTDEDEAVSL
jgi:hypothetical protein